MATIEEVERQVKLWRDNKRYRTEQMPKDLRAKAESLIGRYRSGEILKRLRINVRDLQKSKRVKTLLLKKSMPKKSPERKQLVGDWIVSSLGNLTENSKVLVKLSNGSGHTLEMTFNEPGLVAQIIANYMSCGACK